MKKLAALGALALLLLSFPAQDAPAHSTQCQPVRAVFYTSSDWWQLTQGLAANPSPCAQYYISIDPLTANKTQMRPGAAGQVDAQGPNFHALAEVNYSAWQNWVATTGNSWYAAGQAARASMDAAGFNVAGGDTWAVNEFPSSVRTDTGGARQDAEAFVQGLYTGSGSDPPAQGIVFMIGVGQNGLSFPAYKASLESWFQDSTFWTTMSSYVSDFFFETYGDIRNYAVAGADPVTRVGWLNAFLQHPLTLATAPNAPSSDAAARSYLESAYGPLANASWAWSSNYGWTDTGSDVMADYVSAQTYAMRSFGSGARIGFAWNPLNSQGLDSADFNTQLAGVLDRLAGSIHETDGGDPAQACEATGCSAVIDSASPETDWSTFSSWTPTSATFTSLPASVPTGTPSPPLTVSLRTGAVATTLPNASTVTLSSSSPSGTFAAAPSGPWSPTLTLTIPAGGQSASFYTEDSAGGSPTLSANLNGQLSTQVETVVAPAVTVAPPPAATVTSLAFTPEGDRMHVALRVVGEAGQPLQGELALALRVGTATVATTNGGTSAQGWFALTAAPSLERGCYSVKVMSLSVSGYAWDGASPSQSYCVRSLPAQVGSLAFTPEGDHMRVVVRVVDDTGQPLAARVELALRLDSATVAATSGATSAQGWFGLTAAPRLERGCYSVQVASVTAPGYTWAGASPTESYCVRVLPARVARATFTRRHGHLHVELSVADDAGRPLAARVSFAIRLGTVSYAGTAGHAGSDGELGLTAARKLEPGCYSVTVTALRAPGFLWDGVSPRGRYCVR